MTYAQIVYAACFACEAGVDPEDFTSEIARVFLIAGIPHNGSAVLDWWRQQENVWTDAVQRVLTATENEL